MRELPELADAVATHTLERDLWNEDWEKGVAINGLLATERRVPEARELVDRAVATQTRNGQFAYGWGDYPKAWIERTDFLEGYKPTFNQGPLGHGVLSFHERTGEDRYLEAARRYREFIDTVDRTADGGLSHRRDETELWVDTLYFVSPFLARYAEVTGDEEARDDAVAQIEVQAKHLQDPHTGLFRHNWRETPDSYPQSTYWARGVGWALAAAVDTLSHLPGDHRGWETIPPIVEDAADELLSVQDASGYWHHIVDDADGVASPIETSGTLMFAYVFGLGVELGVLGEEYEGAARRAMDAGMEAVDGRGAVRRVADKPGGPDAPLAVTTFGQGWFLLAASRFL